MTKRAILADRYEIGPLIGEGAFASVYDAHDLQENRDVAVKMLHISNENRHAREVRRRFVREAELVGSIEHPDVVEVYDFGVTDEGGLFIALERLRGTPLNEYLAKEGKMELRRAVWLVVRCLGAIEAAHTIGTVHRDLKPSNLFLETGDGGERLRILDFGLAFIKDQVGNRLSKTGHIHGTLEYLAPEYLQEQIVTPSLDVYQMGLVLAELVSGQPAVSEPTPFACILAHMEGQLRLPEALLNPPFGDVVKKALARDHNARFANAAAFREALATVAVGGEATDLETSLPYDDTDSSVAARGSKRRPRPTRPVPSRQEFGKADNTRPASPRTRKLRDTSEIVMPDKDS